MAREIDTILGDELAEAIGFALLVPSERRAADDQVELFRLLRFERSEFVVHADVVSHLGNGSTDAGAKRLYSMMDKIRMARTGTKKQGRQINPEKFMPA